jgi:hypothetical protein
MHISFSVNDGIALSMHESRVGRNRLFGCRHYVSSGGTASRSALRGKMR